MKGLTKLRPLGRLGGREKTRYGQLGMKSKHGDESDSEDSDFAREDLDYQSGLLRHISFYQTRLSFLSLFMYEVPADQIFFWSLLSLLGDSDDEMEVSFDSSRKGGSSKEKDVDTLNAETGISTNDVSTHMSRSYIYMHTFHFVGIDIE